jgi:hypothetical protein
MNSTVLFLSNFQSQANAWHHRSDSFSSFLSLFSIAAAIFLPRFRAADPAAGIVIAGMIVSTGTEILVESVKQLTGKATLVVIGLVLHFRFHNSLIRRNITQCNTNRLIRRIQRFDRNAPSGEGEEGGGSNECKEHACAASGQRLRGRYDRGRYVP